MTVEFSVVALRVASSQGSGEEHDGTARDRTPTFRETLSLSTINIKKQCFHCMHVEPNKHLDM
jgi:hypothetical protein